MEAMRERTLVGLFVLIAGTLSVMATHLVFAQNASTPGADTRMSFFVTSAGMGKAANFGGLAGADQHCQKLAATVGSDVPFLVLGGTGRLYGGLVGAAVYMIAQDVLAGINPVYWQFWIGALLVVIVLFARGGIMAGLQVAYAKVRRRGA